MAHRQSENKDRRTGALMALTESASIAYGGGQPESPHDHQQTQTLLEESLKDLSASPLNKQNSIFSLTLDEIQLKSGKSFGSMNMDEFLANMWNVDENQVFSQPIQNQNQNQNERPINDNNIIQTEAVPTLTRQNSFSIPIQICKKTVEEVWSEIQKDQTQQPNIIISNHEPPQRQQTFGEMTLEEFLIKAGVVQEPATTKTLALPRQQKFETAIQINNSPAACLDANFGGGCGGGMGTNPMMALGFSTPQNMGNNLLVNGYTTYPFYTPTKIVGVEMGQLSKNNNNNAAKNDKSHGMLESTGGGLNKSNRKRIIDGPQEVVVERRQRRMIKNRESAARSRARKQAYTVELELELTRLKEENEKLKQTVMELEKKRAQEVLKRIKQSKMARKKGEKLKTFRRRTASSAW